MSLPVKTSLPWAGWLLAVLLVMGGWLRLYGLGHDGLWMDEMITAGCYPPHLPLGEVLTRCVDRDFFPPLYPLLLHLWGAGGSETSLRMPSAILGVATLLFAALFLRKGMAPLHHLIFVHLLTFSAGAVYYAQEARAYALYIFFSTVTFGLALAARRALVEGTPFAWWLLSLSATALSYSHYFGILWAAGLFAALLPMAIRHRRPLAVITAGAVVPLAFIPWLLFQFQHLPGGEQTGLIAARILANIQRLGGLLLNNEAAAILLTAAVLLALTFGFSRMLRQGEARFVAGALGLSLLLCTLAFVLKPRLILDRYMLFVLPPFYWLLAFALADLWQKSRSLVKVVVLVALLSPLAFFTGYLTGPYHLPPKEQLRESARYVQQRCQEAAVYIYPATTPSFRYYLGEEARITLLPIPGGDAPEADRSTTAGGCPVLLWATHLSMDHLVLLTRQLGLPADQARFVQFVGVWVVERR